MMTRRRKYVAPAPPIPPFKDTPDEHSPAKELRAHQREVQNIFATHRYDDVVMVCHWCCADTELPYADTDQPRGMRKYCSKRCAKANAQLKHTSTRRDETTIVSTNSLAPVSPVAKNRQAPASKDTQPAEAVRRRRARPKASAESPKSPKSPKASKGTKPKAPKGQKTKTPANRAKGMCPKGLHKMTADNTYSYNGGVWCKECRKESRARSKAKKKAKA